MNIECIFETYVAPLIPLIAAYVVYRLGRHSYFQQKEYELVVERYLKDGIDSISKNVDRSLAVFRHNWWHCTIVLKNFRDLGVDMNRSLYMEGLIEPSPENFDMWRDYRLADIVGDQFLNKVHQSLDAFVKSSYAFFQHDLCHGVRITVEGGKGLKVTATNDEIFENFLEEANEWNARSYRYYSLIGELQKISSIIQTERLDFKQLKKLRERSEVSQSLQRLKELFADEEPDNVLNQ